jgi:hypothetical protein
MACPLAEKEALPAETELFLSRASLSVHARNHTDLLAMADDLFKVHIHRI